LRRKCIEATLETARDAGEDNPRLSRKSLCSPVYDWDNSLRIGIAVVVNVHQGAYGGVKPSSSFYIVQSRNNTVEGFVEHHVFILNLSVMSLDVHPGTTLIDESSSHIGFGTSDVLLPKEELTIEISHVDGIQVNHFDIGNVGHGEILEDFAS